MCNTLNPLEKLIKMDGPVFRISWFILGYIATYGDIRNNSPFGAIALTIPPLRIAFHSTKLNMHQSFTQVISDVDDTLKSSGGIKIGEIALGGIDIQYKRGEMYPGVVQFMLELSLHSQYQQMEIDKCQRALFPPKVAVLTARAEELKVALELKETSKIVMAFRKTGEKLGFKDWGIGPVLYGSVAEWIIQDRKGLRKFSNFERLLEQDPTGVSIQYIYVGDTGELDQEAGQAMLREYPEFIKAIFLHVVSETPFPKIPPPKLINGRPVIFFRTYAGAAAKACQLGLMSVNGMMRVVHAAEESLDGVARSSEKWQDLYRDMNEASRTLDSVAR